MSRQGNGGLTEAQWLKEVDRLLEVFKPTPEEEMLIKECQEMAIQEQEDMRNKSPEGVVYDKKWPRVSDYKSEN